MIPPHRTRLYCPPQMREAPALADKLYTPSPRPRYALLINPFYRKDPHASFGKHVLTPALALPALAAATPPDWHVRVWDENLLQGPPPYDPFPQVVGITVHLTFCRRAYELAAWYRKRGAQVVLGGPHVHSCPDEAQGHADAIAIGSGTALWPQILADAAASRLEPRYTISSGEAPYAEEPLPDRAALPADAFLTRASLIATRGCRNRCRFCFLSTAGVDARFEVCPPAQVAAEFQDAHESYGVFLDNNLGADRRYLGELCVTLQPLERIWSAAVDLGVTDNPSLVREMALAGCTGVFVGFESLNPANLAAAGKRGPPPHEFGARVALFHRYGIQVNGSFVFGFDEDGPDVFEKTVAWIEAQRLECATFHILTPYPGTPLFSQLEREGRMLHTDWERYDTTQAVFRPRRMSAEQLEAGYDWAYRRLFSNASIWRRHPAGVGATLAYLAMSYLYKRANRLWPLLIRYRLTHALWRPLVTASLWRHLRFRRRLAANLEAEGAWAPVAPGV